MNQNHLFFCQSPTCRRTYPGYWRWIRYGDLNFCSQLCLDQFIKYEPDFFTRKIYDYSKTPCRPATSAWPQVTLTQLWGLDGQLDMREIVKGIRWGLKSVGITPSTEIACEAKGADTGFDFTITFRGSVKETL